MTFFKILFIVSLCVEIALLIVVCFARAFKVRMADDLRDDFKTAITTIFVLLLGSAFFVEVL
jgi:hypothetical protein